VDGIILCAGVCSVIAAAKQDQDPEDVSAAPASVVASAEVAAAKVAAAAKATGAAIAAQAQ